MTTRTRVLSVRLSEPEVAHLDQLARLHNVDRSTAVRRLIPAAPCYMLRWGPDPSVPPVPTCDRCADDPPSGFICARCGRGGR